MENAQNMINTTITVNSSALVSIYNILHSIEIKGDAVDRVAYIKQIILQMLNPPETPAQAESSEGE